MGLVRAVGHEAAVDFGALDVRIQLLVSLDGLRPASQETDERRLARGRLDHAAPGALGVAA